VAPGQRRADAVVADATRWLDGVSGSPFFLWTHLYDAHRPYDPPEPFRSRHAGSPYIGEIAFADAQIGRLLAALERRRILDRTIVIVAGDHGESLGDHGERDHGIFVYQSVLRVPLIIRAPGLSPRRVGAVVRLVDVMPTILDMLNVATPAMDGSSLVDLMSRRSGPQHDRDAYAESLYPRHLGWSPLRSLRTGRFKLIEAPRPELYDLVLDPFEKHNIYDQRRTLAASLESRLAALAGTRVASSQGNAAFLSAELKRRLVALGYLEPARGPGLNQAALPDPKDCIAVRNAGGKGPAGPPAPAGCD
jgi:arylsulfatase A-like enzyme